MVCVSESGGKIVDNKERSGKERDAMDSPPHPRRRLRGGKVT